MHEKPALPTAYISERPNASEQQKLFRALARGKTVIYVGAGCSADAGCPSWSSLLQGLLDELHQPQFPRSDIKWLEAALKRGEFLLVAEVLHNALGEKLGQRIKERFQDYLEPTAIHKELVRLNSSLLLTTNYDQLLEIAVKNVFEATFGMHTKVITWTNPLPILDSLRRVDDPLSRESHRTILKLHGDTSDPGNLILTKRQYMGFMHAQRPVQPLLRTLLSTHTFLFVGCSMRDPDLLYFIEEARQHLDTGFGPHFAILPDRDAPRPLREYLSKSLKIETYCYSAEKPHQTAATVQVIREISGGAAREGLRFEPHIDMSSPDFHRTAACSELIRRAVLLTGSVRGDICFMKKERDQTLLIEAQWPNSQAPFEKVHRNSVIDTAFLNRRFDDDWIYVPDTSNAEESLRALGYPKSRYFMAKQEVNSEFACPIISGGRRVGVLNLESNVVNAYTPEHQRVAIALAGRAASIYQVAQDKFRAAEDIREFNDSRKSRFFSMMRMDPQLSALGLRGILYHVNYRDGLLKGVADSLLDSAKSEETKPWKKQFRDEALCTRVYRTARESYHPDAWKAVEAKEVDAAGLRQFNISGPIYGVPIHVRNILTCILVVWSDSGNATDVEVFSSLLERIKRLAHVICNATNPDKSMDVLKELYRSNRRYFSLLEKAGRGKLRLKPPDVLRLQRELLISAISAGPRILRARYWVDVAGVDSRYFRLKCDRFRSEDDRLESLVEMTRSDITSDKSSPYSEFSIDRFEIDPYAKWQHRSMFGIDPNSSALRKDPDGRWLVAPIVQPALADGGKPRLLGFLSMDNHRETPNGPKEEDRTAVEMYFQRYYADLLSDLFLRLAENDVAELERTAGVS